MGCRPKAPGAVDEVAIHDQVYVFARRGATGCPAQEPGEQRAALRRHI